MPEDFLKTVLLPIALILIMFGMGMSLTIADFKRVLSSPKASLIGVAMQLLALPSVAFILATLLKLPGDLAVGLMLLAACPGGPTSNIITHLSKGDTALSVTLTAISSIVTVFTIPLVLSWSMHHFLGAAQVIALPFWKTLVQLLIVTLVPILLGMMVRGRCPDFSQRMGKTVNMVSLAFLVLIIVAAIVKEKDLGSQIATAGPAAILLNLLGMALGFGAAAIFGLPLAQRICISVEVGIQNGTLALAIALGMLESARIAIPSVVYSLFMFLSGAWVVFWFGLRKPAASDKPPLPAS
jgi:BASS family bile acid:Na+ symporter